VVIDRREVEDESVLADLSEVDQTDAAVKEAISRLGGLDNIVLSAGLNSPGLLAETDMHTVAAIVRVNLIGTMIAARAAIPDLLRSAGRLVFIGSTVSRRGNRGHAAYAASKFGVAGLMESLGYELRGRVGLTLVSPGAMDTALFENRSQEWMPDPALMMTPATVAAAVMFALEQPPGVSIRELVITHDNAPDWP
jgi:NAD(P)-dependent dehydrogenase (short-subunit alcohol dehydrogenase family)